MDKCSQCNKELEEMYLEKEVDGYETGNYYVCHNCKIIRRKCEVYSRVVGYLRPVDQWNKGKQTEFKVRKTYKVEV